MRARSFSVVGAGILLSAVTACSPSPEEPVTQESAPQGSTPRGSASQESTSQDLASLPSLTSLDVSTETEMELTVDSDREQEVQVDNGIGKVATKVSSQVLKVSQTGTRGKVTITIPRLDSVSLADGSDITATGETDSYKLIMVRGSNASAEGLSAKQMTVDLTEACNTDISASDSVDGALKLGSSLKVFGGGIYNDGGDGATVTGQFNGVALPADTGQGSVILNATLGNGPDDIFFE